MTAELRGALAAVCFLTRLPLGRWVTLDGSDVARAGIAFPVIGAGIGAAVGASAAALAGGLSTLLAVAIALTVGTVLTGALHLDALADTADALGASGRERALEIMRDSTIGAFGAVAIALDVLIKAAALTSLVEYDRVVRFAVAAGALSRAAPVALAAWLPYARGASGTGLAIARTGWVRAVLAAALGLGIAAAVAGLNGLEVGGCIAALALILGLAFARWLGGITGDALGAVVEVCETAALVIAVALVGSR